jgi:hypothetical protein
LFRKVDEAFLHQSPEIVTSKHSGGIAPLVAVGANVPVIVETRVATTATEKSEDIASRRSVFDLAKYKIIRGPDLALQWDPPAGSKALKAALSYRYPLGDLESKMRAAIKRFLETETSYSENVREKNTSSAFHITDMDIDSQVPKPLTASIGTAFGGRVRESGGPMNAGGKENKYFTDPVPMSEDEDEINMDKFYEDDVKWGKMTDDDKRKNVIERNRSVIFTNSRG